MHIRGSWLECNRLQRHTKRQRMWKAQARQARGSGLKSLFPLDKDAFYHHDIISCDKSLVGTGSDYRRQPWKSLLLYDRMHHSKTHMACLLGINSDCTMGWDPFWIRILIFKHLRFIIMEEYMTLFVMRAQRLRKKWPIYLIIMLIHKWFYHMGPGCHSIYHPYHAWTKEFDDAVQARGHWGWYLTTMCRTDPFNLFWSIFKLIHKSRNGKLGFCAGE